jgi:Fur family ferric uptake transcriptional regulator
MKHKPQKRHTQQLQIVYQAVCQSGSHPSADEVYRYARQLLPRISLGTVYHNLQRLVEEGKIGVFLSGERTARYDPTIEDHAHFVCQHCSQIEDVFLEQPLLAINLSPLLRSGYTISAHSLVIDGLCPSCQQKSPSCETAG